MPRTNVRSLRCREEFEACERIQRNVWGTLGAASEVLSVTRKYGGAVLGAFVGGEIVGFLYAFLGRRHSRLIHWSHMMAVERGFRDMGLGFRLKKAHRRLALRQRVSYICWTYDPLQSRNATLNIARLGGRGEEYLTNCYGRFPSTIEKGLPSDRVVVNWHITSATVDRRLKGKEPLAAPLSLPRANITALNTDGFLENRRIALNLRYPRMLVEIPPDSDAMRDRGLNLARRWRMETRQIFQHYYGAGYQVTDFLPPVRAEGRCFYVLRQQRRKSRILTH